MGVLGAWVAVLGACVAVVGLVLGAITAGTSRIPDGPDGALPYLTSREGGRGAMRLFK